MGAPCFPPTPLQEVVTFLDGRLGLAVKGYRALSKMWYC